MKTKFIRDYFTDYSDENLTQVLREYIEKKHFDDIFETTAKDVLLEYHSSSGTIVKSWPSKTCEILKELEPEHKVKIYRRFSDGWGCIYENNQIIEIL